MPRYHVTLTEEEREELKGYRQGKHNARTCLVATALLMLDEGQSAPLQETRPTVMEVAHLLDVSDRVLNKWKKKFVEEGLDAVLSRNKNPLRCRAVKFDGDFAAKVIALACTQPPPGRSRWTVRLLAEKVVELRYADTVSTMTVQRVLKKRISTSPLRILENPTPTQCGFRSQHGRCTGGLQKALRPSISRCVHGRVQPTTHW